jgi:uncharacterized protein YcfL
MNKLSDKWIALILISLAIVGCSVAKKPAVVDPCDKVPGICWGKAGVNPSDIELCNKVTACYDWEIRKR